ncbi:S41 family peptidase [Dyadobacter sp. CY312]|uniref:S41 family peptidase n=1 Tax=Dyadobacter sp. CY312 TaxID=2907303 RepID=UPI001F426C8F|nr:S41 family peptidase [Dyadobacter sp. CY312]MCE7042510.1 S41 family peptidase [Dyadobacter sp. CY312]
MKLFKIIILFSLLSNPVFGQSEQCTGYRNDLIFLKKSLEENYPSLYRFKSKASINKLFDDCIQEIDSRTSEKDFYKTLKLILSHIEDGHLNCSAPDSLRQLIDVKEKHFPLSLYFTEDKTYVDCSNLLGFPSGTEITEINGVSISAIKKNLFNYIVSDGKIEAKKYWILNHSFWFYFSLVYGQHKEYMITYKNSNGQLLKTTVNAVHEKEIQCKSLTDNNDDKLVDLKFLHQNIALLTIRTFANDDLQSANIDFADFLNSTFNEIKTKKITSLIIDLRLNGGGRDTYGALLYSYLCDTTFHYYQQLETSSKILDEKEHPNLSLQQPKNNYFPGKVYILINGLSFSVTSEFCTIVKNNNRAIFIGEETGGTYCGNTSGNFIETSLPYSKFIVFTPTTKYTMVTTDKNNIDRGIIPDYIIKPTVADLINKKDVQLSLGIKLAEKNNSR